MPNAAALVAALRALPGGETSAPEVPDLRPQYAGGRAPAPGATTFVIRSWQVRGEPLCVCGVTMCVRGGPSRVRARAGGKPCCAPGRRLTPPPTHAPPQLDSKRWAQYTRADAPPSAVARWSFENVEVAQFAYPHCYHGPLTQVGVVMFVMLSVCVWFCRGGGCREVAQFAFPHCDHGD